MTDIELLPLPRWLKDGSFYIMDAPALGQGVRDYARANAAHHTAKLQAEIEALRAEVGRWRTEATEVANGAAVAIKQAETRAERLAEALREARQMIRDLLPDATFTKWDALLRNQGADNGESDG